ncbi:glycosyltransferase family 4 protein [Photobacterium leiognathi]|uniref:glycosyltransferase family 4 protein n=1 Tax=Photobacterium leiognathi TaxID=553611 RepID=UPI0029827C64|nr:glycosyltransferase family 4 protein [Photobacterium leiognathi]
MKIVFLSKIIPAEGSTIQQLYLGEELVKKGHQVTILTAINPNETDNEKKVRKQIIDAGIKIESIPFSTIPLGKESKIKLLAKYIYALPYALRVLYRIKPNVIHCHWPVTSYIAAIYRKLTGVKFISTYHALNIPKSLLNRNANKLIAISSDLKKDVISRGIYQEEDIIINHNGVRLKSYNDVKESNDIVELLFVGRVNDDKGFDVLLRALSIINDIDFKLSVIGDCEEKNHIKYKEYITNNSLDDKIIFYGYKKPDFFYKKSDILILPSRSEGFPLVVIEAMMYGVSIIRSNVGGAYDQINDGVDGFIFENENAEQLAEKLNILIESEELRNKFSLKGKEKAINSFTAEINAKKMIDIYNSLCD